MWPSAKTPDALELAEGAVESAFEPVRPASRHRALHNPYTISTCMTFTMFTLGWQASRHAERLARAVTYFCLPIGPESARLAGPEIPSSFFSGI